MAAPVLQFKRGLLTNLPGLRAGEPGFTTDSYELYVGIDSTTSNNKFFGSHRYWTREDTTTGSSVNLVEGSNNGSNYVALKSPDTLAANLTYTLPGTDGSSGHVLSTNGSGSLSFIDTASSTETLTNKTFDVNGTGNSLSNVEVADFAATAIVLESEGIGSNDNDTTLPTSAAVKDYVDNEVTTVTNSIAAQDLDFAGDSGTGSVDLGTQSLTIAGTANEVETSGSGQTLTIGLPSTVQITTSLDVPTVEATNLKARDGTTSITITDSTGAVATASNLTVGGNLIVNGSTTQVNTSQTTIEDQLLELGMVDGSAPSSDLNKDIGLIFNYYTSSAKKAAVYWDDSSSRVVISDDVSESTGVLTAAAHAALEIGSLWVNDCAGQSQVINCSGSTRTLENITIDAGTF
jgi:hypothetical protein